MIESSNQPFSSGHEFPDLSNFILIPLVPLAKLIECTHMPSEFVSDLPEEFFPLYPVAGCFHTLRWEAIDDAENPPAQRRRCHNNLERVRSGAVNMADLGAGLDLAEDIYGKCVPEVYAEDVACAD